MTIEQAVALLGIGGSVATAFLTIFVGWKIGASEARVMKEINKRFLPRELAAAKFQLVDLRLDSLGATRAPRMPVEMMNPEDEEDA